MNDKKRWLTCAEVNEWDIVDYLHHIGYDPQKIRGNDCWYLSPLRNESTPSFKVNRNINRWYDHGIGKGGKTIDFALLYYDGTIAEILQKFDNCFSFQPPPLLAIERYPPERERITVKHTSAITSTPLLTYLKERRIPVLLADKYCVQIHYQLHDKIYYGIGFKNDSGGYEIRNRFFKGSAAPKGITTVKNGRQTIAVFEGFFDFLSYLFIATISDLEECDFCILNSLSFAETAIRLLDSYECINLYLDNDTAGQNCSRLLLSRANKYTDRRGLYKNYKDLNDWLMHPGLHTLPP